MSLLALHNISFRRGRGEILHDVNLVLARGEITAIIGSNGAGKTTLLSIAAGLLAPTSGAVEKAPALRLGWAGDKPALFPDWTVGMFLAWQTAEQGSDKAVLAQVIAGCGLETVLDTPCKALSHGFRQRVSLAQALLCRPDVLFCDEPGNGLDPQQKMLLRGILRGAATGAAVLMIHHDLDEVLALADRIFILENGRLVPAYLPQADLLWCEWQSLAAAENAPQPFLQLGRFTAHRLPAERLAALPDLLALSRRLPAAVFQLYQERYDAESA